MKKEINKKYEHKTIEKGKYEFWLENDLFSPSRSGEPFSIILPPPNVTGKLHLGHAWDASYQDMLIRYKKLQGYSALWVPGTDHAGIATQTKFEKILKDEFNLTKDILGKDEFLKRLWIWKEDQANFIRSQWKKLGLVLSYKHEKFTMDKDVNKIVNNVFINLFEKGLIYKSYKLVNWDVQLKTAISNIEVVYKEVKTKMYYFKYYLEDKSDYFIVATTRPETMYGDQCLFANPNDKRYLKYKSKKFINPINGKKIPLLFDEYIDLDFGTGLMKCTPGHDFNDYELAKKYNLELVNILNEDGTLNDLCKEFNGIDRLKARELIVDKLSKEGFLEKIEEITSNIGFSERTNSIVEPILSNQWFLKMKNLAKQIMNKQQKDGVNFIPSRFNKVLLNWLENIEDWCISRQLWWGHQLPIWINKQTNEIYCSELMPNDNNDWIREEYVLDTWFSSSLWPLVCLGWQTNEELFNKYYPSNVLVTGYDIIFFWVSRMIAQSLENVDQIPFKNVLIHGLIRDENGKKMSKSLGNGIDPMDVIEWYGADALRLFLTSSSTLGEDLNFSKDKISYYWNFNNKIWNSFRFINNYVQENNFQYNDKLEIDKLDILDFFILDKLNKITKIVISNYESYNFVISTKELVNFIWDDFNNNYLELCKIKLKNNNLYSLNVLLFVLKQSLILLHPQAPFITEEIYQNLFSNIKKSIMLENFPKQIDLSKYNEYIEASSIMINIIEMIRKIRKDNNLSFRDQLTIKIDAIEKKHNHIIDKFRNDIEFYIKSNNVLIDNNLEKINTKSFVGKFTIIYYKNNIDFNPEKEIALLEEQYKKVIFEYERANKILSNQNFVNKASQELVQKEKQKQQDFKNKKDILELEIKKIKEKYEIN